MMLVERQQELELLRARLESARQGSGRVVLLAGEAGIGKTALLRAFLEDVRGARLLQGACDPLATPRPLGPLLDIAERLGGVLTDLDATSSRDRFFRGFLEEMSTRAWPTIIAVEDAHWADEATLDLLRYLSRRIDGVSALLLVTYRPQDVGEDHPVVRLAGDLAAGGAVERVELGPLSPGAVRAIAQACAAPGTDARELHRVTGGNPFYVTEVIAAGADTVPATVRDAVLARAARLDASARRVLEAASVSPTRIELRLLDGLVGEGAEAVDACVGAGVLRGDAPGTVAFRHELARRAVHEAIPPARAAALHGRAAELLLAGAGARADPARIAHHAELAGDGALAFEQAVLAARRAEDLGAHREAADQHERALRHAAGRPAEEVAAALEAYVPVAVDTNRGDRAVDAAEQAVRLRRRLGDPLRHGQALVLQSRAVWNAGRAQEAYELAQEALSVLAPLGPSAELAEAHVVIAHDRMLARDLSGAAEWGVRALALAEQVGAPGHASRALLTIGTARILDGDPAGAEDIHRGLSRSEAGGGDQGMAASAWINLGSAAGEVRDYPVAVDALRTGIDHARRRDLDGLADYGTAWLARVRFEQGDYAEASRLVDELPLDRAGGWAIVTITGLTVRGGVGVRTGAAGGEGLERAWALAEQTGDLQRTWPVAAVLAERAWLDGAALPEVVPPVYALACSLRSRWAGGELALWMHRAGRLEEVPDWLAEPYRLQIAGASAAAAAAWEAIGCPYERAAALADSGAVDEQQEALAIFDRLGAAPAAAALRRRLRAAGVRGVPRGPRRTTAANPAGLTARQAEVLDLLALGLSDAQIADRLSISPKTCGHHVSAVLARLGAASRTEAAHRARELGLLAE